MDGESLGLTPEALSYGMTFFPESSELLLDVVKHNRRFVHYTSAEVAASIIQNGTIWMRNAVTMNDFSEVEHGLRCVDGAWGKSDAGKRLQEKLNQLHPGLTDEIVKLFVDWLPDLRGNTFLTCLSEHLDEEDDHGRLSMWRAYGGRNGVALVVNNTPMMTVTDALGANTSPVRYKTDEQYSASFETVSRNICEDTHGYIKTLNRQQLRDAVFTFLRFSALCTKHPGFAEEREWRIVYSPGINASQVITSEVRTVRGTPQIIQKLPLRHAPEAGLNRADIPSLVSRLIIGPCDEQGSMVQAFAALLGEAGVDDPYSRIQISEFPSDNSPLLQCDIALRL